ncbi:hypothetical protein ZTR_01472 [Talaromyces verruculosus]|nr:hypothetical protein ZTR_01472 [Talaromyces verruculosus]
MSSKEKPTRFHPYDTTKKPKIHPSDNTTPKRRHNNTTQKQPSNKNSTGDNKGLSINDLKRRIRDVKRLLTKAENLSPEARIVQERALKGYERDLELEKARRQRSEMIRKYHFVRFLDRKTATKRLRAAQRQYEKAKQQQKTEKELSVLQKRIDTAQIDVNYTIYYPLTEKYLSLYPQEKKKEIVEGHNQNVAKGDDDDNEEKSGEEDMQTSEDDKPAERKGEKPAMWNIIKNCMANKTLDKLRDGKLNIGFDGKPLQSVEGTATDQVVKSAAGKEKVDTGATTKKEERKRKRKEVEVEQPNEEEEDSDGGFFEE